MRYLAIIATGFVCLAAGVASAEAAGGDLSFVNCVSTNTAGCTPTLPGSNALAGAYGVAASPDGNDVYVAGDAAYAIGHFRRDAATGGLTFVNCIGEAATVGCIDIPPTNALQGAISPVVSPDGHSVYVASFGGNSISHFERNTTTGDLTFENCIAQGVAGCTSIAPTQALSSANYVAITPDGRGVYTSGNGQGTAAAFQRNTTTGDLTFVNCVGQGATNCANISPTNALDGAIAIAASPDGKDLYVASENSNAIAHLSRNTSTNALTFANCIAQGATGCASVAPTDAFDNSQGIAASSDGANIYSTANTSETVVTLKRDSATGDLSFVSCLGQGATGCTDISPTVALDGALGVAVAPDGGNAYVSAFGTPAVSSFRRGEGGSLTFQSCIGASAPGCAAAAFPLDTPAYLTVNPAGTSVYVPDEDTDSIIAFKRQFTPTCQASATTVPFGKATRIAMSCSDSNGDPITLAVAAKPAHGTLSEIDQATGKLTYTPAKNFAGSDTFSFTGSDGDAASPATAAKLTVTAAALVKLPGSARVSKGKAKLTLACPAAVLGSCDGSLSLEATKRALASKRKKKAKPVRLGSKKFSIAAGKQASVAVALSGRAKRVLGRKGKLKVTAIAVSKDGAGTSATQRATVKLKGKKKRK